MQTKIGFQVLPLRYFPSLTTEEFVNVGVGIVCPSTGWWDVRVAKRLSNLTKVFPSAKPSVIATALQGIRTAVEAFHEERNPRPHAGNETLSEMRRVVGSLVGALRWAENPVEGVTDDPSVELAYWFETLVRAAHPVQLEKLPKESISPTSAVEEKMRQALQKSGVWEHLKPAKVRSYVTHEFKHTYRNGQLHVFQPISLDQSERKLIDTAELWRGRIDSLGDSATERFSFIPLIELPDDAKRNASAEQALQIISNSKTTPVHAFTTKQIEEFGAFVKDLVEAPH